MNRSALELRVPPLIVLTVAAALMWLVAQAAPALSIAIPGRLPLALLAFAVGLTFALAGVVAFRKARTTVNPMRPENTTSVVASGVYRISRNPMYVGMLFALAGWAIVLSHAGSLALLPAFVVYMNAFQIRAEERALSAQFGAEYAAYSRAVRRWL